MNSIIREKYVLNNGIPVIIYNKKDAPVAVEINYNVGSRFDPILKDGLTHYVEHMILHSKTSIGGKGELSLYFSERGGSIGASTSKRNLCINFAIGDSIDLNDTFGVVVELLKGFSVHDNILELERGAIISEIRKKDLQLPYRANILSSNSFYGEGSLLSRENIGNVEVVKKITKEDVVNFYNNVLCTDRLSIVISGEVNSNTLIPFLNNIFNFKSVAILNPIFKELKFAKNGLVQIKKIDNSKEVALSLKLKTDKFLSDDTAVLNILSNILFSGSSSVFMKKLRYETGLVYSVGGGQVGFEDFGFFTLNTSCIRENVIHVLSQIYNTFDELKKNKISDVLLLQARNRIIKSEKLRLQTVQSIINVNSDGIMLDLDYDYYNYLKKIKEVSIDDVNKVFNKYFTGSQWGVGLVGDVEESNIDILSWKPW